MPNVYLSEDYLVRMINQALAALAAILGLKASGQLREAQQLIHQTLESLFGLRTSLLLQLDDERLKEMMTFQGELNVQLMWVAADLLEEEAELLQARGDLQSAHSLSVRALGFYLEAALSGRAGGEAGLPAKIDRLLHFLRDIPLPESTSSLLFEYSQSTAQSQQAEPEDSSTGSVQPGDKGSRSLPASRGAAKAQRRGLRRK